MAKEIVAQIKLQAAGGQATPAPPIGPALGQHNVNIGQFVSQFNDRTREYAGTPIPVVITVYKDKSFSFILKQPPVSAQIKKAAGIESGAQKPGPLAEAGKITKKQVQEIAGRKIAEMTASSVEQAMKTVAGTARSMGVKVVD